MYIIPKRNLTCNCCGESAGRFAQWWNRDTGFGQCGRCTDWGLSRGETLGHVHDMAGVAGIHRPIGEIERRLLELHPDAATWDDSQRMKEAVAGIVANG